MKKDHLITNQLTDDDPVVDVSGIDDWTTAVTDAPGVGRYARLLPVSDPGDLRSVDAALRPVSCPELAAALRVESVDLIPQTLNETGTFKDNEAVLLAARCKELRISEVCMHSSGNTARAYQHYMDRLGISCTGFVPRGSVYKCPQAAVGKCRIQAVDGNMSDAADQAIAHAASTRAVRLTPSTWKVEGKVPLGMAIAEHCTATTTIAVTIASGYGPLGIQRAVDRVRAAGLPAPKDHRYRLFQAEDAAPIATAIRTRAEEIDLSTLAAPERAFEPTLQSTNPNRSLPLIRNLVDLTNSLITPVSVRAVERHAETLREACERRSIPINYELEKSAYICWAGLAEEARQGRLDKRERITMIVSG